MSSFLASNKKQPANAGWKCGWFRLASVGVTLWHQGQYIKVGPSCFLQHIYERLFIDLLCPQFAGLYQLRFTGILADHQIARILTD
jgi:hypothetical protein